MKDVLLRKLRAYKNSPSESLLKALIKDLISEYLSAYNPGNPLIQAANMTRFFSEIDGILTGQAEVTISSSDNETPTADTVDADEFWSLAALELLPSCIAKAEDQRTGLFRARSDKNPDNLLVSSILHRQLFGKNFSQATADYPSEWAPWQAFIESKFKDLTNRLESNKLDKKLWLSVYQAISHSVNEADPKRASKIVHPLFFAVINSFMPLVVNVSQDGTVSFKLSDVATRIRAATPQNSDGDVKASAVDVRSDMSTLMNLWCHVYEQIPLFIPGSELATLAEAIDVLNTDISTTLTVRYPSFYTTVYDGSLDEVDIVPTSSSSTAYTQADRVTARALTKPGSATFSPGGSGPHGQVPPPDCSACVML